MYLYSFSFSWSNLFLHTYQRRNFYFSILFAYFLKIFTPPTEAYMVYPPFYSPCNFPVPGEVEHRHVCHLISQLPFICDLHKQLGQHSLYNAIQTFAKHRTVLQDEGIFQIGIVIVRQLHQPTTTSVLTPDNDEFGCIFSIPCITMTMERIDKFVNNIRTFTKLYTSALHMRWFSPEKCLKPRVLALVVVDGLVTDTRKLTNVVLYSDDARMTPFITNIQLESTNAILQGVRDFTRGVPVAARNSLLPGYARHFRFGSGYPLEEIIADLIDQIGYAYRDFYSNKGVPRTYHIPLWAWEIAGFSVSLVVLALLVEWVIVRRRISVKRTIAGLPTATIKSKTHMIF